MLNLNENEIIKTFVEHFKAKSDSVYGLNLSIKGLQIEKPQPTPEFKEFKNGKTSSRTEVNFELSGWKSYAEDGVKSFMQSLLEDDDAFAPIIGLDVYEVQNKGKTTVNMFFSMVYTGYEVTTDAQVKSDIKKGVMNREDIIEEIEIRLSEIYTLLKKLRS